MKPIEILVPDRNPLIIFPDAIQTIGYMGKNKDSKNADKITIMLTGRIKPIVYEGPVAKSIYEKLKQHYDSVSLDFNS